MYSIPCLNGDRCGEGEFVGEECVCVNSEFNGNIDGTLKDFLMMVAVVVVVKGGNKTNLNLLYIILLLNLEVEPLAFLFWCKYSGDQ